MVRFLPCRRFAKSSGVTLLFIVDRIGHRVETTAGNRDGANNTPDRTGFCALQPYIVTVADERSPGDDLSYIF
jgi:hypothetical protein